MQMTREELLTWAYGQLELSGGTLYVQGPGGFSATLTTKSNGVILVDLD